MQAIKTDLIVSTPPIAAQPGSNSMTLNTQQADFKKTLQDTDDKPVRKGGKHLPDPGNDPPAAPVPVPVTAIATLPTNLAIVVPIVGAVTPPVIDSQSLANVEAAAGAAVAAGAVADPGQGFALAPVAPPLGANLDTLAPNPLPVVSGSTFAATEKIASSTAIAAAAPPAAQTAVKAGTVAVTNTRLVGNDAVGAVTKSADAVGANAATGDPGSSAAAPTADANVTSQTLLASTLAAAATNAEAAAITVAPAASSSSSADTLATPATGAAPTAAANMAAPVAADAAQPATAAAAASVAQVVIGAAESSAAEKHSHTPTADKAPASLGIEGATGFAQLINNSSSADAAPANLKVATGVDTPGFAQGVGSQVQVMVDNNLNTAKLQVSPSSLGPIEVRIAIQNGHAQVWMTSHSAVTRDALESSTPQLKEMLGSQGFSQVSVDISQRSFQERTPQPHAYDWQPLSDADSAVPIQSVTASAARGGSGVVDAYA